MMFQKNTYADAILRSLLCLEVEEEKRYLLPKYYDDGDSVSDSVSDSESDSSKNGWVEVKFKSRSEIISSPKSTLSIAIILGAIILLIIIGSVVARMFLKPRSDINKPVSVSDNEVQVDSLFLKSYVLDDLHCNSITERDVDRELLATHADNKISFLEETFESSFDYLYNEGVVSQDDGVQVIILPNVENSYSHDHQLDDRPRQHTFTIRSAGNNLWNQEEQKLVHVVNNNSESRSDNRLDEAVNILRDNNVRFSGGKLSDKVVRMLTELIPNSTSQQILSILSKREEEQVEAPAPNDFLVLTETKTSGTQYLESHWEIFLGDSGEFPMVFHVLDSDQNQHHFNFFDLSKGRMEDHMKSHWETASMYLKWQYPIKTFLETLSLREQVFIHRFMHDRSELVKSGWWTEEKTQKKKSDFQTKFEQNKLAKHILSISW